MKVLIPLAEGFDEMEAITTANVLRRAGIEVTLAGVPGTIVQGARKIKVIADKNIEDVESEDFDAIVLPGGNPGYINLSKSKRVTKMITDMNERGKLVAAICGSPSILAKLGILDNKRATIYPGMERELPKPRTGKVIVDGNIITSQGPGTAVDFALEIITKLQSKFKADDMREQLVYQ
jgi:4-methyl-5(b-hydroxyethyl)-thiazole monophosphate biosynthesis